MKKKQIAALVMASVMTLSMTMGQIAFAQSSESTVVEKSQDTDNAAEKEQKETSEDTDESREAEEKTETKGKDTKDESTVQSDKKDTESDVAVQSDGVSTQAEDPVIDSSARTVTYNNPIDITLDANSSQSQGFIYAIGDDDKAPSNRNYTYIYNAPVHVTFDGVTADIGTLTETNKGAGFNTWQFNDTVTVDIKNSNFKNFATLGMFWSISALFGDEKAPTVQMNGKLTYNISNSTINILVGGMLKNGAFPGNSWPPVKINSNCQIDGGLEVNISEKSNIAGVFAGHVFTANDEKESTNQTFTMSSATINVDDSTVGGVVVSRAQSANASDRTKDLVLTGDLNVNLKNGATLTSALVGNKCNYGENDVYLCGEVTGTTTFTTDSEQTMAQIRNVDQLNLGGALNIVPATEDTGARMTLRDTGMKINLTNPNQWKTGDTVLTYKYTDGTYPKVDENQVSNNWNESSMSLEYEDDTASSMQKWTFKRSEVKVSIKEEDGTKDYGDITVTPNDKISWDQIPEEVKKPGYEISGWKKEDGSVWDLDKDVVTSDMTIHPIWKLERPDVALETAGNVTEVHTGQGLKLTATATHGGPDGVAYSFVWYKDGQEIRDVEAANEVATQAADGSSSIIVREAGEYSVKVTATDGNQNSDEVECGPIAITVTDHNFDGDWEKNETDHWHVCTVEGCDVKEGEAAHTFGEWTVTKEATEAEAGSKEAVCTVCGYKKTEVIPATGDSKDPTQDDSNKDPNKDPNKPGDNSGDQNAGNQNNGAQNNGNQSSGNYTTVQVKKAVRTGDANGIGLALAGMLIAAGAGVSAGVIRKRR